MKKIIPHSRPTLGRAEAAAASRVLLSGQVAQGPEIASFEREAADFLGLRAAAAVSTGTTALELSLDALGVGAGHEVLIPDYSCSALLHAVRRTGAEPVLVDCEDGGDNADMRDAARKRTRRTKAIILVHLFGETADIAGARALGVPLIEDCAQALGGRFHGKPLGSFGEACVLSFYATKMITTGGEGGMVVSSHQGLVERIRDLREYDEKPASTPRRNAKLTDLQAAVGRVQLGRLDSFLRLRAKIAAAYDEAFRGLDVLIPRDPEESAHFRYVLRLNAGRRDAVARRLLRLGVSARVPIFRPLHHDMGGGRFPQAERAWKESLSIPLYPSLSPSDQAKVIAAVRSAL